MLVKHEVQKDVGVVDSVTLCAVFQEAHTIVNDMVEAHKLLKSFCEDPYDEFELADDLEALSVFDYSNITKFKMWFASKSLVTNKYLGKTYHKMGILEKKLSAAVDCSCALNEDEFAALRDLTYDVASGMLFFIISEFDILNLANADKSTQTPQTASKSVSEWISLQPQWYILLRAYLLFRQDRNSSVQSHSQAVWHLTTTAIDRLMP